MHRKVSHLQSVLLPRDQFANQKEAEQHVEKMGYNAYFKKAPDVTKNYYRFRQEVPLRDANYKTIKLGNEGDKGIIMEDKQRMGRDNKGTWKPEFWSEEYKKQHQDVPKYHMLGTTRKMGLSNAEMYMIDKNRDKPYMNIHDLRSKNIEIQPTKGLDFHRRKMDYPHTINLKKLEKMNSFKHPIYQSNMNFVSGLSN